MQLSIVIPTLNEAGQIGPLLDHLQSLIGDKPAEIIVVDGGSTDGSVDEIEQRPYVCFLSTSAGRAIQLNRGAHQAKGEWLYFLHADTIPPPDLWHWVQHVEERQLHSAGFSLRFDDDHALLRFCAACSRLNWTAFRYGDQSLLVRRSTFEQLGGYREDHLLLEDNELARRLRKLGRFQLLPASVLTSARKYRQYGPIYLQSTYVLLYLAARLGVGQKQLARWQRRLLSRPRIKAC